MSTQSKDPPLRTSEPTIRRLLQLIDANAVDQAFSNWFRSLTGEGLAIAIDGKTLKGARQQDGSQIHLLSAFLQQKGIVIAQCEVESSTADYLFTVKDNQPTLKQHIRDLDLVSFPPSAPND